MSVVATPVTNEQLEEIAARSAGRRLIRGGHMLLCPGCLEEQDILAYRPFNLNQDFAEELVAVLRCTRCAHIFALRDPEGGVC